MAKLAGAHCLVLYSHTQHSNNLMQRRLLHIVMIRLKKFKRAVQRLFVPDEGLQPGYPVLFGDLLECL